MNQLSMPAEFVRRFDDLVNLVAKELAVVQDKLTQEQLTEAIRQMIMSQDFCLVKVMDQKEQMIRGGKMFIEITQKVVYTPYGGLIEHQNKFNRYKEAVNSILNVEQQQLLAQKLHEIQDTQDA